MVDYIGWDIGSRGTCPRGHGCGRCTEIRVGVEFLAFAYVAMEAYSALSLFVPVPFAAVLLHCLAEC